MLCLLYVPNNISIACKEMDIFRGKEIALKNGDSGLVVNY